MGGTRFIGVFLARLLVKEGHQVLKIWFLTIGKPILLTVRMIEAQIITGRWLCLLEEKQPSPNSCQVNQTRIMLNFLPRYIMYLVYMNSHSFIPGFISIHSLLRNDQHVPSAWKLFLDFFFSLVGFAFERRQKGLWICENQSCSWRLWCCLRYKWCVQCTWYISAFNERHILFSSFEFSHYLWVYLTFYLQENKYLT